MCAGKAAVAGLKADEARGVYTSRQRVAQARAWFGLWVGVDTVEPCAGKTAATSHSELGIFWYDAKGSTHLTRWAKVEEDLACPDCGGSGEVVVVGRSHPTATSPTERVRECEACEGSGSITGRKP